jgi:hypothetical protein
VACKTQKQCMCSNVGEKRVSQLSQHANGSIVQHLMRATDFPCHDATDKLLVNECRYPWRYGRHSSFCGKPTNQHFIFNAIPKSTHKHAHPGDILRKERCRRRCRSEVVMVKTQHDKRHTHLALTLKGFVVPLDLE